MTFRWLLGWPNPTLPNPTQPHPTTNNFQKFTTDHQQFSKLYRWPPNNCKILPLTTNKFRNFATCHQKHQKIHNWPVTVHKISQLTTNNSQNFTTDHKKFTTCHNWLPTIHKISCLLDILWITFDQLSLTFRPTLLDSYTFYTTGLFPGAIFFHPL